VARGGPVLLIALLSEVDLFALTEFRAALLLGWQTFVSHSAGSLMA
jgi:hypothetical protein